jgi:hypothetical protein
VRLESGLVNWTTGRPERSEGPTWTRTTDAQTVGIRRGIHAGPSLRSGRQ